MAAKTLFITFDTDFADYIDNSNHFDEMDEAFDGIKDILGRHPAIKTTWFIRIDGQIEQIYGSADHLYNKHLDKINWLKDNGHSIGWHHHSYKKNEAGNWVQNTDEDVIVSEIDKYGQIAISKGMDMCRMGWGFHTNKTLQLVDAFGFRIDSSAIPRPNYKWDMSVKDWQTTSQDWYYPSVQDYRIPGEDHLSILEAPMSTVVLPTPTDTEENVMRYINPAYHEEYFNKAINGIKDIDKIITITHPYELIHNKGRHTLLSFNMNAFENNLKYAESMGYIFSVLK